MVNRTEGRTFNGSFRVTIPTKMTGAIRVFRQFKEKVDAEDFAEKQYAGFCSVGRGFFTLTEEARRDAYEAWSIAIPHDISLVEAAKLAVEHLRPEGGSRTVEQVVSELAESKEQRFEEGDLRQRSLKDFRSRSGRFATDFGERIVNTMTCEELKEWLLGLVDPVNRRRLSPRSRKNYRMVLGEVLTYARQKRYIFANPLDDLTSEEAKLIQGGNGESHEPSILSVDEAKRLLETGQRHPEMGMLGVVTLGFVLRH